MYVCVHGIWASNNIGIISCIDALLGLALLLSFCIEYEGELVNHGSENVS